MKALEMLKAKKSQLLPVVASEKTRLATAEAPSFVVVAIVASKKTYLKTKTDFKKIMLLLSATLSSLYPQLIKLSSEQPCNN